MACRSPPAWARPPSWTRGLDPPGEAIHTSTFLGHPLGCAAGLGFLAALEAEDFVGRARRGGRRALAYLKSALDGCDRVLEVRGRGLLIGIELAADGDSEPAVGVARKALRTGMGRTGALLGCQHEGLRPDLGCLGKALGGGVPISACVGPAAVMDAWPGSTGEAIHTSTFLGHPLGCAAGLGFLAALEAEDFVGRARRGGRRALAYLKAALDGCDRVLEVRGRGLLIGIELAGDGGSEPAVGVARKALRQGVIVLPAGVRGEVVELAPPAMVAASELERGLEEVVAAVRSTVA